MSRKALFALLFGSLFLALITGLGTAQEDGDPLPIFSSTYFTGSGDCARCHSQLAGADGQDISFDTDWRPSMMANAARDPLWLAKVESEILRTSSLQAAIEYKCATCHMPMAHTEGTADGTEVAIYGDGFLNPENRLHEAAMDGTSCSLCHQIENEGLGDPETFSGHFPIDTEITNHRLIFGRYADPDVKRMTGFVAESGLHMEDSANCATCHTLYTTAYDEDGNSIDGAAPFPEQVPYLEWENSSFGDGKGEDSSCQDCHMPPAAGPARIANRGRAPLRTDFGQHYFDGSNAFMLEMMRDNGDELGVTASSEHFNAAIVRTEQKLVQETADIVVTGSELTDSTLLMDFRVSNLTGHKFPTGIPIRRSWIHLKVVDGAGRMIFESGAPQADGRISGNDADEEPGSYEPHYRQITDAGQVQIYEGIMADWNDEVTYTLLRATTFAKDNRLLPAGFDKNSVPTDVQVFGLARVDGDFAGGQDEIQYEIPISAAVWPLTVTAELLYQPVSYGFVQDLAWDSPALLEFDETEATEAAYVDRFLGYFVTADHSAELVSQVSTIVEEPLANSLSALIKRLLVINAN